MQPVDAEVDAEHRSRHDDLRHDAAIGEQAVQAGL